MDSGTFLYLLVYPDLNAFKIGKANDVLKRSEVIQRWWGVPDHDASYYVGLPTGIVFEVEKALHLMLGSHAVHYEEGEGKTEFFKLDALEHALSLLKVYNSVNGCDLEVKQGVDKRVHKRPNEQKMSMAYKRHNAGYRRLNGVMIENAGRLGRILRLHNLLLRHQHRIDLTVDKRECGYTLTFRSHLYLAHLFECSLCFISGSLAQPNGVNVNFIAGVTRSDEDVVVEYRIHNVKAFRKDNEYAVMFFCSELEASLALLESASFRKARSTQSLSDEIIAQVS